MLSDQIAIEPEFIDGSLRTDQLDAFVVLLVIGILYEYLAFGQARIGVLPDIARCCDGHAGIRPAWTSESLHE